MFCFDVTICYWGRFGGWEGSVFCFCGGVVGVVETLQNEFLDSVLISVSYLLQERKWGRFTFFSEISCCKACCRLFLICFEEIVCKSEEARIPSMMAEYCALSAGRTCRC
jgi:hypothetical protein